MKKNIFLIGIALMGILLVASCKNSAKRSQPAKSKVSATTDKTDSTLYGVCGEGTAMNSLELITDAGDTINYLIDDEEGAEPVVKGGLFEGDRMAVIGHKGEGDWIATNVINLTALMGKWTSIDKDFEILEGGTVKSFVKEETHPWTSWKIYNGRLVLNKDTFTIDNLGADSLYLENHAGIFAFKRHK